MEPVHHARSRRDDRLVPLHPYHLFGSETLFPVWNDNRAQLVASTEFLGSIVVSISACHAEDPGSIPGRGALFIFLSQTFFKTVPN